MKKMNFTLTFSRYFALLLPMFLLSVGSTWANNEHNTHATERSKSERKLFAITAPTLVATPTTVCNLNNGTITVTSTVSGYISPYSVEITLFNMADGSIVATRTVANGTAINELFTGLAPATYIGSIRVVRGGATVETSTDGQATVIRAADVLAPVITAASATVSVNVGATCTLPVIPVGALSAANATLLGVSATDNCGTATMSVVSVTPAIAVGVASAVVIRATDGTNSTGAGTGDVTVTITPVDNIPAVITVMVNGQLVACGGTLTLVPTGNATGVVVNYTATATDNCPAPGTVVAVTGAVGNFTTGTTITAGSTQTLSFTAGGTTCAITVTVPCREKRTIFLDAACSRTLTLADVGAIAGPLMIRKLTTAGQQDFVDRYPFNSTTATIVFGRGDIGTEFEIMTGTGANMCFHYVTVLDNLPPVATAKTFSIRCIDLLEGGKAPSPAVLGDWVNASNRLGSVALGTATDCSSFRQDWEDIAGPVTPCATNGVYQTIIRRWTLKDIYGNTTVVDQTITVRSPTITIPATVDELNCNLSVANAGLPVIVWGPTLANQTFTQADFGRDFCGVTVNRTDLPTMPLCKGSYMIMRSYKIGRCGVFTTQDQTINVWDRTTPKVQLTFDDYLRVKETQCFNMNGMQLTEFVYKTVRTPIDLSFGNSSAGAVAANANTTVASIKITPLVSSINCNEAAISLNYTVSDPNCSGGLGGQLRLTSDNPAIRFGMAGMAASSTMLVANGTTVQITGTFTNIPGNPDPVVRVFATDDCGNVTEVKITVVIYDNVTPTSICEKKQVSLTNNGQAVVFPSTFSQQTYDNCFANGAPIPPATGSIRQLIRLTTPGNNGCWLDRLVLDCNTPNGKVDVRTIDGCGNYSDCCVDFEIVNKPAPGCIPFMDVTTTCMDPKLADINSFFTKPVTTFNCGEPTMETSTPTLTLDCGAGTATKTWKFTANGKSVECSQRLVVTAERGFRVTPRANTSVTCSYTVDIAEETKWVLDRIKNQRGTGATAVATCIQPQVLVEVDEFRSDYCKKIVIKYTVIDMCAPGVFSVTGNVVGDENGANPTRAEVQDINGKVVFWRVIAVNDVTPPVSQDRVLTDICTVACTANFPAVTLTGSDECGANVPVATTRLFFQWFLRSPTGAIVTSGNSAVIPVTTNDAFKNLGFGKWTIEYIVTDFCGNTNPTVYKIEQTIKDCAEPWILLHDKTLTLGGTKTAPTGVVCYADIQNNIGDNCIARDVLDSKVRIERADAPNTGYSASLPTCLTNVFTCADATAGYVDLRVWYTDGTFTKFTIHRITVIGNICNNPLASIRGTLRTENNQSVANVNVTASINGTSVGTGSTDNTGEFALTAPLDQNVQVKAVKIATEDKYAGVTTFDIARISKHVLDIEKLTSPYTIIAADVDKSNEVDAADMLHIRNFILRKTSSLPGGIWRFIDKSYKFTNPTNPFGEDFPEVVNLSKLPAAAQANFVATKLGDVNTTYTSALTGVQVRSSNALTLLAQDMQLVAGNEYTVNISADNFNAAAFQGTFSLNGATVKSVKAGDLANYNDGNIGIFANDITTSWNGTSALNANVMTITLVANKTAKLSEVLSVGSSLTPAVANDANGTEMNVNLKFTSGKVSGGEFALYQNRPNPVAIETTVGFNLPTESSAKLTVYNVEGKVIMVKKGDYKAGYNEININKSDLNASGVMYYRLETPEHTATKKMIIIE